MTIQIELDPATEARLVAQAEARGLDAGEYAGTLLRDSVPWSLAKSKRTFPEGLRVLTETLTNGSESRPILSLAANDRESY